MRERISSAANYAKSVALGEVLRAAVFHTSVDTSFYSAGHRGIFEPIFLSVVALRRPHQRRAVLFNRPDVDSDLQPPCVSCC